MPKRADPAKLRAAREAKGFSLVQVELETYVRGFKVARNTVAKLEKGDSGGTIDVLGRLAEVYGVASVDDLMTDIPAGPSPLKPSGKRASARASKR